MKTFQTALFVLLVVALLLPGSPGKTEGLAPANQAAMTPTRVLPTPADDCDLAEQTPVPGGYTCTKFQETPGPTATLEPTLTPTDRVRHPKATETPEAYPLPIDPYPLPQGEDLQGIWASFIKWIQAR